MLLLTSFLDGVKDTFEKKIIMPMTLNYRPCQQYITITMSWGKLKQEFLVRGKESFIIYKKTNNNKKRRKKRSKPSPVWATSSA